MGGGPAKKSLATIMAEAERAAKGDGVGGAKNPHPSPPPDCRERGQETGGGAAEIPVGPVDANDLAGVWRGTLAVLGQKGQAITGLVCQGEFGGFDAEGCAILKYASAHSGLVRMLEKKEKRDSLVEAFSRVVGKAVGVRFEIGEAIEVPVGGEKSVSAVAKAQARGEAAPESAARLTAEKRAEIEADPLVKAILDSFGGVVLDRSVSI